MARAGASVSLSRLSARGVARLIGVGSLLALTGCIGSSTFDELNSAQPAGSQFNEALFKNYSYLARSFGTQSAPSGQAFDAIGAISLTGADNTVEGLANAYALKALAAARDDDVLPEPAPDTDADAQNVRLELLRDLDEGRDKAPDLAARAQADYDCWLMDRRVDSLANAAQSCRRSVTHSLAVLEHAAGPEPAPASAPDETPAPVADTSAPAVDTSAPAPAPQAVTFTIYFDPHSAKVVGDQLDTVARAIAAARSGRQTHITIVGHSDTAEDSQKLSERRADAVASQLVLEGARAASIAASGVGTDDLAVQTGDHVKELKNRNAVITLLP